MELIQTSLAHKIAPLGNQGEGPFPTVVLLHGRGASEDDLLGLLPYFDPRFFVVAARAPFRFLYGGWTWYEIQEVGAPHPKQFAESYDRLVQFVQDVKEHYPVDPKRLFFLGFSMGAVMSYAYALTKPEDVRGVVAHSGYIPENTSLNLRLDSLNGTSFFVAHGTEDPVIQIHFARRAKELLSQTKADLVYKEYPIPHTMSEASLADLTAWLKERLER